MSFRIVGTRALIALLTFSLAGSELQLAAQTAATSRDPAQTNPQNRVVIPPPTAGPWEKKPGTQSPNGTNLPDAPSATPKEPSTTYLDANQQPEAESADAQAIPQNSQTPVGTAAAEKGVTVGGAASKPAGNAIAPAKQRQARTLALKIGAIVAGGVALGTVYGLSRKTTSVPPGSGR